jgi:hypothetical protein
LLSKEDDRERLQKTLGPEPIDISNPMLQVSITSCFAVPAQSHRGSSLDANSDRVDGDKNGSAMFGSVTRTAYPRKDHHSIA